MVDQEVGSPVQEVEDPPIAKFCIMGEISGRVVQYDLKTLTVGLLFDCLWLVAGRSDKPLIAAF